MGNETIRMFPGSDFEFLASTWLQQQDLHDKSVTEIAELYYSALNQIREKYSSTKPHPAGGRVINPGIKMDDW